jgi:hypothetical protein
VHSPHSALTAMSGSPTQQWATTIVTIRTTVPPIAAITAKHTSRKTVPSTPCWANSAQERPVGAPPPVGGHQHHDAKDHVQGHDDPVGHGRVLRLPAPAYEHPAHGGRPPKHGGEFDLKDPDSWPEPAVTTINKTASFGKAETRSWNRLHPRLTHRAAWLDHQGTLPIVEGTLIRLQVEHLPGDRDAQPMWLWCSRTGADPEDVDRIWQAYLRRFDLEHTFRLFKQTLGWTKPKLRDPRSADRWTWIMIAAHTQLRLARPLAVDLRRPWERPSPPDRLTPARVRRGFRNLRPTSALPAAAPKPSRPGPGRPRGSKNHHRATRYDVGKTVKCETSLGGPPRRKPKARG